MTSIGVIFRRILLFGVLWWALWEGQVIVSASAAFAVGTATLVSLWFVPPGRWGWRWSALARFIPFFLKESVLGGVDVARRALSPTPALRPGLMHYQLDLDRESARVFFAYVVCLVPGTLSARLEGDGILVHALDESLPIRSRLEALEREVARAFPPGVHERVERG